MFQINVVEKLEIHIFLSNVLFFRKSCRYLIMWQNTVERSRPHLTIWHIPIACWVTKATNAHWGCVILFAFPAQQWLHERDSMLRYTYFAFIVFTVVMTYVTTYVWRLSESRLFHVLWILISCWNRWKANTTYISWLPDKLGFPSQPYANNWNSKVL